MVILLVKVDGVMIDDLFWFLAYPLCVCVRSTARIENRMGNEERDKSDALKQIKSSPEVLAQHDVFEFV